MAIIATVALFKEPYIPKYKYVTSQFSVDAIFNSFSNNEYAANSQFLEKEIFVRGRLSAINPLLNDQTILKLEGNANGSVRCLFDTRKLYEKIRELKPNSEVILKGKCIGFLDDVYLTNCTLLSVKNIN